MTKLRRQVFSIILRVVIRTTSLLVLSLCCSVTTKMDERKKILFYIITHLVRSNLRRRRTLSLLLWYLGRSRRRIEEQRNFLAQASITLQQNFATMFLYFSGRAGREKVLDSAAPTTLVRRYARTARFAF